MYRGSKDWKHTNNWRIGSPSNTQTMRTYKVTIEARITKTIEVKASSEEEAEEMANELFSPQPDKGFSAYDQEVISIE